MKKSAKGAAPGAQSRSIRTLSRKENPHEHKRSQVPDHHTYHNSSGLFPPSQHDRSNSQVPRGSNLPQPQAKQPIELSFQVSSGNTSHLQQMKMNLKKKNDQTFHKHSISNSNARSMNNFLNTEPLAQSQKPMGNSGAGENQQQSNALQAQGAQAVSAASQEHLKQYEDRKKVVAAIYLNTMSIKIQNGDNNRQRRRQSDSGVL